MNILVIKHGALGDIVLAVPSFMAIRQAHPAARITLLTTAAFAAWLAATPWFDRVLADARPAAWNLPGLWRLRRQLRGFDLVYDLQTSSRSARYFALAGRPRWSGIAAGCALPHANPGRDAMHTRERLAEQLALAGLSALPPPDLAPLQADTARFQLPDRFALLIPGASPHRPEKRWPAQNFAALAAALPMPSVIVGGAGEADLAAAIAATAPGSRNLAGHTSLADLAGIAARASLAIGNDTGPMHLAAAAGVPCAVLFSAASDPALTAPRRPAGGWPIILRAAHLSDLPVAEVLAALP